MHVRNSDLVRSRDTPSLLIGSVGHVTRGLIRSRDAVGEGRSGGRVSGRGRGSGQGSGLG